MLNETKLVAFVPTTDFGKAKSFYGGTLGLSLVEESKFALEYNANGVSLRVTKVQSLKAQPFTVLGWEVPDVRAAVQKLSDQGIRFEIFQGMGQDDLGIWNAPGGTKVAWFKDPDGNVLSLSQHPAKG